MSVRPQIPCRGCGGCGRETLPAGHWEVLQLLEQRGELTAFEVHGLIKYEGTVSAISNRLADLLAWGLADRVRRGRHWVYRAR